MASSLTNGEGPVGLDQAQREPRSLLHTVKVMETYGQIATKAARQTGHSGRELVLGLDVLTPFSETDKTVTRAQALPLCICKLKCL